MDALHDQKALVAALFRQGGFPHPTAALDQVETHISTVLLVGEHAYKIKKPINLGFLDFSTLEARRGFCHDEVMINRQLAPGVYLDVVTINGSLDAPQIGGAGPVLEYAVHMRRFNRDRQLDRLLAAGQLPVTAMDDLGQIIARFHAQAEAATAASGHGSPASVVAPMRANFQTLRERARLNPGRNELLATLEAWTETQADRHHSLLLARAAGGHIRAIHGDMHLGNMVYVDGPDGKALPAIFDAIEFNPELRWIDTVSELAFLTMDLTARGAPAHAHRVLSTYLDHYPDYSGLSLLPFYQVYRALVRAKVNAILGSEPGQETAAQDRCESEVAHYLNLAEQLSQAQRPFLLLMHGVSGSGKTHVSSELVAQTGAVRLRSDIIRRQLAGLDPTQRPDANTQNTFYAAQGIARVYSRMREFAAEILAAGRPVLVDATFLHRDQRRLFAELAQSMNIPWLIIACQAPAEQLRQRLSTRHAQGNDASDADIAVMEKQWQSLEAPGPDEPTLTIDTSAEMSPTLLVPWLRDQGIAVPKEE